MKQDSINSVIFLCNEGEKEKEGGSEVLNNRIVNYIEFHTLEILKPPLNFHLPFKFKYNFNTDLNRFNDIPFNLHA